MASPPAVAVCTNRTPAEAAEALATLARQLPGDRIAVVTSGLPASLVAAFRDIAPGPVLEERDPGLSRARNRALAWAPADGVLAFVDDDAVVSPGWAEALERAWAEADADVGCIGGPIRPRWTRQPPAWVSDPILPALTLLDLGPDPFELDPSVTTVYGANISFAVAALRAIGGFDPRLGHSGARVSFSEEDEAQRELARHGRRVLYAPDMVVEHVIGEDRLTRGSFVRRRFAYGRALGTRGARSRAVALTQLGRSAAGALIAAARADGAKFMERAVRAAENAGALTARRRTP
ncbi:MAG: glycosyltransferase family 2 protein [Thermoleophilaceae bacterium]